MYWSSGIVIPPRVRRWDAVANVRIGELLRGLFQVEAVDEHDVRIRERPCVRRRWLERVAIGPFGHDAREIDLVSTDVLGDVRDR